MQERSEDSLPVDNRIRLLEERRQLQETEAWQATILFFVAEGALLATILDPDRSRVSGMLLSGVGVVVSLAILHLYARARYSEVLCGEIVNRSFGTRASQLRDEAFPPDCRRWWNYSPAVEWFTTRLAIRWVVGTTMVGSVVLNVVLFAAFSTGWTPS